MNIVKNGQSRQQALKKADNLNISYTTLSGDKIKFGQVKTIPLNQILYDDKNNRRKYISHVNKMVDKIKEYGFLGVIVVFQSKKNDSDGNPIYNPAEGNHRTDALKIIFGEDSEVEIPVLLLPYDEETKDFSVDNRERALEVIIGLNKDNRAWSIKDYIEGWAKTKRQSYVRLNNTINENANKYRQLTPSITSYVFTQGKGPRYTKLIENGDFEIRDFTRPYVNLMLDSVRDWTNRYGTKKWEIHPTFLSNFVARTYKEMLGSNLKNGSVIKSKMETDVDNKVYKDNDVYSHFEGWLSFAEKEISKRLAATGHVIKSHNLTNKKDISQHSSLFLPTASDDFKNLFDEWYENYSKENPLQKTKGIQKFAA